MEDRADARREEGQTGPEPLEVGGPGNSEKAVSEAPGLQLHVSRIEHPEAEVDPIQKVLAKVGDLAALPQVVCQVIEGTDGEEACARKLEQTILIDPGLSAKLLTQANSAYYALPNKVTSIREAVMFLGFRGVRQIAMAVGVFDMFLGKTDKESMRRRTWWRHSLDTAVMGRGMSEMVNGVTADEAYTCGLLHLIGKTILDRFNPVQYEKVQAVVDQGAPDILAERAVFTCDHIAVAHAAAKMWGFPDVLVAGLDYFTPAREPKPDDTLRAMTAFSSKVVKLIAQGKGFDEIGADQIPGWILDSLNLTDNKVKALVKVGVDALESASSLSL